MVQAVESAARARGIELRRLEIRDTPGLETAVNDAAKLGTSALLVLGSPLFYRHQSSLARLATKHRLPVVSPWPEFPEAGGLASYGTVVTEMFQRAAGLVDKILKGTKPAELPVELPTTFELVVNLKAARALGLTVPVPVRLRADRLIE